MTTSDIILLGGVFETSAQTGSQSSGAGAGKAVTSVTFDVYGVNNPGSIGSQGSGAGAGKVTYTDLGSVTVKLTDFGQNAYGVLAFAATTSTPYSSFLIKEASSPTLGVFNANSSATISEPNGTLTLIERTI